MSRYPKKASTVAKENITKEYIQFLFTHAIPTAMTIEEIIQASTDDREMKGLRAAIKMNQ